MISYVWPFLESYGWFVVLGGILSYVVYSNYISPKLEEVRAAKELESRKKFDEDVYTREADRMAAARERQQQKHDAVSAELKMKEEEAKEKKLEELRKAMESESVLKYAVNTPKKTNPAKKETAGEIIDRFIQSKAIVMFSKSYCPFCRKAKSVLATLRLSQDEYIYIELDERDDLPGEEIQQEFIKRYGSRSVPKVFIGGECIGGGDDTVALFQQGVLEEMVRAAVAASAK